jgi:hypothetical protein
MDNLLKVQIDVLQNTPVEGHGPFRDQYARGSVSWRITAPVRMSARGPLAVAPCGIGDLYER